LSMSKDADLNGTSIPLLQEIEMKILSFEVFNEGLTACNTEVNFFVTIEGSTESEIHLVIKIYSPRKASAVCMRLNRQVG
jgi:hypothetical protein